MKLLKPVYNVFRSLVMTMIMLLVVLYVGLYVVLSVPSVHNKVKQRLCLEVSRLLGGELEISGLSIHPFSEVVLTDVILLSPDGERCASIGKVAAGIDLWSLLAERRIVLNYAEVIGLDFDVVQKTEGSEFNIRFLIDALSSNDKDKAPTPFDLRIRNVVVRNSKASISRPWITDSISGLFGYSDIKVDGIRIDLSIPVLRNDMLRFDVRNIEFDMTPGVEVTGLSADVAYVKDPAGIKPDRLSVKDLNISFPRSSLDVADIDLNLGSLTDVDAEIQGYLTPADFCAIIPRLDKFDTTWDIGVQGSLKGQKIRLDRFVLLHGDSGSSVNIKGMADGIRNRDSLDINVEELKVQLSSRLLTDFMGVLPRISKKSMDMVGSMGLLNLDFTGCLHPGGTAEAEGTLSSSVGELVFNASGRRIYSKIPEIKADVHAEDLQLDRLLSSNIVGNVSADIKAHLTGLGKNTEGVVEVHSDELILAGNRLDGLELRLRRENQQVDVMMEAFSAETSVKIDGNAWLAGNESMITADIDISGFRPSSYGITGKMADSTVSGAISATAYGNNADNVTGQVSMDRLSIWDPNGRRLDIPSTTIRIDSIPTGPENPSMVIHDFFPRAIAVESDWIDARFAGVIHPSTLVYEMMELVSTVFPTLMPKGKAQHQWKPMTNDFTFDINVKGVAEPYAFLNTPVRPLTDIPIRGVFDAPQGKVSVSMETPHLQQGKNKLIRDLAFKLDMDANVGIVRVNTGLVFPAKKGDAQIAVDLYGLRDKVRVDLAINPTMESKVKGNVALGASFSRMPDPFKTEGELAVRVDIMPSALTVNDKVWMIADGGIDYTGKRISVSNMLVSHDQQYVKIDGTASENDEDQLTVRLNDIDLVYIFNLLNINYVSFGGMATGEVVGRRLLTKAPEARTEFLRVKGLSYNGAELGDGDLASDYDALDQKVGIYAVIRDPLTRQRRVNVDGGIWVTRDSLSFAFDADKVNVAIMKPFVSAFCSDIYGEASGKCSLFGTFSDIDLVGDLRADTLSMKLDFTNTWYHAGGDSVFLHKGVIEIPPLTLYDDEKHTAEFSGWLRHRYFHEPSFSFRLRDAKSLLCYDTNEKINPLWYGTIYGSGHAQINGYPGLIEIDMNMTTEENSKFYYVISDAEDVAQYSFLTFTDKRKESLRNAEVDSIPDYLKKFRRQTQEMEAASSNVVLSIKGTVTNDALVTLMMDPKAGDNITARGQGALQMDYNLASNDLRMIGTYVLDEGNYNFTLQDIIIKNFNIRKGSLIKFDGDPMKAMLDIAATYRVNTNLTDLDKSFSTDKDLNRTNVPVDAVLLVDGPMTNPDITFDIELPSLTSDVERKVKSIVSTNDMMSRQIIYLLALNRFYTPEYTAGQNYAGSEWSSMASSTISSQLSNILSQMTDKLDVSPSFRSEKGDFSDMEFDLALSSRLLNNRLLINGNFGYRDKNTSNTQFVGDFDIEYLLSKNGNLRLKAYNHFNDQNYYLRSALTTQGVGVVFRKDFDRLFGLKKKEDWEVKEEVNDSTNHLKLEQWEVQRARVDSTGMVESNVKLEKTKK